MRLTMRAMSPIKKVSVSEWAEMHMQLPATSAEPGRYRISRTPYVKNVMDSFTQSGVHKVVVKSSSQVGKSTILLAVIGRFAQVDPCPIMIVQPTLEMAQDFSKDRLNRLINDTAVLRPLFKDLNKSRKSAQTILSKYYAGGRIVLQGANSPAGLASRPIRILLCDEVDRFPASAGEEGDPIALAEKRQSSYWNYKTGLFSTPTLEGLSRIDAEYLQGTQEEWRHACPNCGEYHVLKNESMLADYEEREDELKRRTYYVKSVKWRCPDCGHEFGEAAMKGAAQKYVAREPEALRKGIRSFFINGYSSPWVSWQALQQEWLSAKGNAALEAVVYNTRFGESYRARGEFEDEGQFMRRLEDYGAEVPAAVEVLTAGVDVQSNRLEYEICGWGVGEECYGIQRGVIWGSPTKDSTWQKLDEVLKREYKRPGGDLKIVRTFIDSGYLTDKVYEFCQVRQAAGVFPIKGRAGIGLPILHQVGRAKNARVVLMILGVDTIKAEVMSRLGVEKAGAMYCHFAQEDDYLERGYDAVYFRQLTAEHLVARKANGQVRLAWETLENQKRNEALDMRGYALAAFKSLRTTGVEKPATSSFKTLSRCRALDIF